MLLLTNVLSNESTSTVKGIKTWSILLSRAYEKWPLRWSVKLCSWMDHIHPYHLNMVATLFGHELFIMCFVRIFVCVCVMEMYLCVQFSFFVFLCCLCWIGVDEEGMASSYPYHPSPQCSLIHIEWNDTRIQVWKQSLVLFFKKMLIAGQKVS